MENIKAPDWAKFSFGQLVEKKEGARWVGRIVGFYSTDLNPQGYAVESVTEIGNVQIYPEGALQPALFREGRPEGAFKSALNLHWCHGSSTVRQMPENYLAADLSRIDSSLWGREHEIGRLMAAGPEVVRLAELMLHRWPDYLNFALQCGEDETGEYITQARNYERWMRSILAIAKGDAA